MTDDIEEDEDVQPLEEGKYMCICGQATVEVRGERCHMCKAEQEPVHLTLTSEEMELLVDSVARNGVRLSDLAREVRSCVEAIPATRYRAEDATIADGASMSLRTLQRKLEELQKKEIKAL